MMQEPFIPDLDGQQAAADSNDLIDLMRQAWSRDRAMKAMCYSLGFGIGTQAISREEVEAILDYAQERASKRMDELKKAGLL